MPEKESNDQEAEGFTKVPSKKRHNKRATPQQNKKGPKTNNSFATLNQLNVNENEPVSEARKTSMDQDQQDEVPLEIFLKPPTANVVEEKNTLKGKDQITELIAEAMEE